MRPLTIQTKLLGIFVVAAVLPLVAVGIISYHNSLEAVEEMVSNRNERLALSVGKNLSRRLSERLGDRLFLTNEPVQDYLQAMNGQGAKAQLDAYLNLQSYSGTLFEVYGHYYREMILADAAGDPVFRTDRSRGAARTVRSEVSPMVAPSPPLADTLSLPPEPQEIPLPGLNESVEAWSRSLQAREAAEATDLDGLMGQKEREGLARDVVEKLQAAFAVPDVEIEIEGSQDPRDVRTRRTPRIRDVLAGGKYTDNDRDAAKNGLLLPRDVNWIFIHRSESGAPLSVRLVQPVFSNRDEEDRIGVMILDIRLDYLFPENLATERFGAQGELAIVDSGTGEMLFHSDPGLIGQEIRLVRPALADVIRRQREKEGGANTSSRVELADERGRQIASVVDIGAGTGWMVVATAFPREFETEAHQAGVYNLVVASVAVLVALLVLIGSSRRISSSIHQVTEGAREIATGNLSHSIRVHSRDEIETLANTFNSMTASLRENISLREKAAAELEALNRTLEERVQERTYELEALNEALNRANQELKELDRLKSNFLATVSHEFRTPLTSITAFSEILIDEMAESQGTQEVKRFLGIINTESERLGRLIKNLLDLSRIEAGRMLWDESRFPIEDVINAAKDGLLPVLSEKQIDVVTELDCPGAQVNADRDRIQQVITNLLENAIKFSHKGKRIWLGCRQAPQKSNGKPALQVTVKDEGPGIPERHLFQIFERFEQVDSTDTRGAGGSGLGLAISREIVEHHGGRIWAESREGTGAAFHFTLPCASDSAEEPGPGSGTATTRTTEETKHA